MSLDDGIESLLALVALRLLQQAWAITDRIFPSLQPLLNLLTCSPSPSPSISFPSSSLLASAALRLLQQAWSITDRIFPSLQPLLLPPSLSFPKSIRITSTSSTASGDVGGGEVMVLAAAASIRGVCCHDTDRAVRLVLSVQAAIESPSPLVAAFGLDALAALCAADAVVQAAIESPSPLVAAFGLDALAALCAADAVVRLVLSVQAGIESPHPLVAALGLDALAALCAADNVGRGREEVCCLWPCASHIAPSQPITSSPCPSRFNPSQSTTTSDFFTAWKVVSRSHPSLPAHPITAARLCHLLQSAALDAAAYPNATRGIMEGLWEAARKGREGELIEGGGGGGGEGEREWRQTRAAAFTALAAFTVDDVATTWPYPSTHLLRAFLSEPSPSVRQAMLPLLTKLADYQHRTRPRGRRAVVVGGGEGAEGDVASAATSAGAPGGATWRSNKLLAALPRLLCPESFGGRKGKDGLDVPAAALLLVPPPPPEPLSGASAGSVRQARVDLEKALKERDAHFHRIFLETSQSLSRPAFFPLVLSSLAAWTHFMRQWYRARCRLLHATAAAAPAGGAATAAAAVGGTETGIGGAAGGGGLVGAVPPGDVPAAAARGLWSTVTQGFDSGVPMQAENSALALAALCQALPPALHPLVASAADLLRGRLKDGGTSAGWGVEETGEGEEERRGGGGGGGGGVGRRGGVGGEGRGVGGAGWVAVSGWADALALGAVGGCLHATDAHMRLRIAILHTRVSQIIQMDVWVTCAVSGWADAVALAAVGGCLHAMDAHMRLRIAILLTRVSQFT
ncbi:unnamed protein product, partial [Closterium sp. Naga37s-1]